MAETRFLVTGADGCIGSWVLRRLLDRGLPFVATDLSPAPGRPRLLLSEEELSTLDWRALDVTDTVAVRAAVADTGATHVIHLAGLQVPFCKADPPLGAAVNVTGTVNVFEAVRHEGLPGLAYASSLAALGPPDFYDATPVPDSGPTAPATLYGVYKVANEETARIYAQDWGVGSAGLRPSIVYGVARDQGISSDIAKAVLAVAADRPFHIRFSGLVSLQHASDMAEMFIRAALAEPKDAVICNVRNDVVDVRDVVRVLDGLAPGHRVTAVDNAPLPVSADLSDAALRGLIGDIPYTPLDTAIARDIEMYRALLARGAIDLQQLER